jgi:hypothetical protein
MSEENPLKKFGTAKIAGMTCNKNAPAVLRIDLHVAQDQLQSILKELNLEYTPELAASLNALATKLKPEEK